MKLRPFCITALAILCSIMHAVPAWRGWQHRTLVDGTQITVRQVGDEFYHYWETEDEHLAVEQADGTFVVTNEPRPDTGQVAARRQAARKLLSNTGNIRQLQKKAPKAIGDRNFAPRGIVILVQFPDVKFNAKNDVTAFSNLLNKRGYEENGASGSAVDYFSTQSNGKYTPIFDVIGPVTLPKNLAYYGAAGTILGVDVNDRYVADLVIDAVLAADELGCDFSLYNNDGDDQVDFVYFFIAGKGQAAGGSSETIWPHNYNLISAMYNGYMHEREDYYIKVDANWNILDYKLLECDGVYINNYACSAELKLNGNFSGIGTFCHEFSHVLGLPDYYDTQNGENKTNSVTPSRWSIMDYGSYNNDERTPPNYSIYDKYFMGWATPKFLAKDAVADITITTDYNDAYQITGGSNIVDYTNTNTVYYIENRQQTGWDAYLPWHGMLVWQVKYDPIIWSNNAPNNTAGDPRYTLLSAGGGTMIDDVYDKDKEEWVHYGAYDPFPGYLNVNSCTLYTGCAMTDITETSEGNITLKYNSNAAQQTYSLNGVNCFVPANGTVSTNAELSLAITPNTGYSLADARCWNVQMGENTLIYGTDFTWNAATNTFRIPVVTADVQISAHAYPVITWYADGSIHATNIAVENKITFPEAPATCLSGRRFAGWCTNAGYTNKSTAPTWAKPGDSYTVNTYYAVYGEEGTGIANKTVVFEDLASAYSWENGEPYTSIVDDLVYIEAIGGENNGKYYTSDKTWRGYSGGTIRVSVFGGSVTEITPAFGLYTKAKGSFTITNGIATLAPTARTDFLSLVVNYSPYIYFSTTCAPSVHTYTVIFQDKDGTPLGEPQVVEEGSAAIAPDVEIPACRALSWDKDFSHVTENMTVTAVWTDAPLASGTCGAEGDNLTWALSCDGVLTIKGTGEMADFDPSVRTSYAPWGAYSTYRNQIKTVQIEDGITSIGTYAFYWCANLISISIPNTITCIPQGAFQYCEHLSSIAIPNDVKTIGDKAFYQCLNLVSITLPDELLSIGEQAFYGDAKIKSIFIPRKVAEIKEFAFFGCTAITSISVDTKNIYYDSREDCNAIIETASNMLILGCKNSFIPVGVTQIGTCAFAYCTDLPSITIPNSVTEIGRMAFYECSMLKNIIIPRSVTTIQDDAFRGCSGIKSMIIPDNVEFIGIWAFQECSALASIVFKNPTPPTFGSNNLNGAFGDAPCKLYVPCGSKTAYLTAVNDGVTNTSSLIASSRIEETLNYTYSVTSSNDEYGTVKYSHEPTSCSDMALSFRADATEGYEFVQWSDGNTDNPRTLTLTQDTTLTAEWIRLWTITWKNHDGTVLATDKVRHGNTPAYDGEEPTRTATAQYTYIFSGWTPAITAATGDITYTATFTPVVNTFTVTFKDEDKSILSEQKVEYGSDAIAPDVEIPVCRALSWDKEFTNITTDLTVTAVWTVLPVPYKWSLTSADNSKGTVVPTLEPKTCPDVTLSFRADAAEGYEFVQWSDGNTDNPRTLTLTQDTALVATFTASSSPHNTYTVIFQDEDGTPLGEPQVVEEGSAAIAPDVEIPACRALSWDKEFSNITTDLVVTAIWSSAPRISGTCGAKGDNLTWELSCEGILFINGSGEMEDYSTETPAPWHIYLNDIQSVTLSEDITHIGAEAFTMCQGIKSITLPASLTSIGSGAFSYTNLTDVIIPEGITTIERAVFMQCLSLRTIILPGTITFIGSQALAWCGSLENVTCLALTPPSLDESAFEHVCNRTVYVTCASHEAYKAAAGWRDLDNILAIDAISITYSVTSSDEAKGKVSITEQTEYCDRTELTIVAEAEEGYEFVQWSDGCSDNPRSITLIQDSVLIAEWRLFIPVEEGSLRICLGMNEFTILNNPYLTDIYIHDDSGKYSMIVTRTPSPLLITLPGNWPNGYYRVEFDNGSHVFLIQKR